MNLHGSLGFLVEACYRKIDVAIVDYYSDPFIWFSYFIFCNVIYTTGYMYTLAIY